MIKAMTDCKGIIVSACEMAGVGRKTYYEWLKKDKIFKEAIDIVFEEQVDFVEGKLLGRINMNDTTAIIFYLKTKAKHRGYSEQQFIDLTSGGEKLDMRPVILAPPKKDE